MEHDDFDSPAFAAEVIAETAWRVQGYGEVFEHWIDYRGDLLDAIETFDECFIGQFRNHEELAQYLMEQYFEEKWPAGEEARLILTLVRNGDMIIRRAVDEQSLFAFFTPPF